MGHNLGLGCATGIKVVEIGDLLHNLQGTEWPPTTNKGIVPSVKSAGIHAPEVSEGLVVEARLAGLRPFSPCSYQSVLRPVSVFGYCGPKCGIVGCCNYWQTILRIPVLKWVLGCIVETGNVDTGLFSTPV